MPKIVHSSQFIVHGNAATVNREPITVNRPHWRRAFTLIELLVVITIISILIAAVSASFTNAQAKSRDGKRKSDLKSVQQALEVYLQQNGKYPDSSGGKIKCNVTGDSTVIEWEYPTDPSKTTFKCNTITYIQQLPKDPAYQSTQGYYYNNPSQFTYILSAKLENTNDPDLTGLPCIPATSRNYCVINP